MAQQNSRAQQQRRQLIIVLVVILIMGFGLFYFVLGGDKAKSKKSAPPPEGKVSVPELRKNFKMGERISNKDFRITYYDPEEVPIDALIKPSEFVGRFASKPLLAGNYIHEGDVTQPGATSNFSGIVSPGKRLVVIDGGLFPGALDVLNVGDHIDLLAIGEPNSASSRTRGGGKTAADSAVSIEGGGGQPGDVNSGARRNARARRGAAGTVVGAASATLVAENAVVMKKPRADKNRNFLVLEMEPQDAHVTTLMVSAGAVMRYVFRPFNEDVRHTEPEPIKVTTRLPKPSPDPDAVMFIMGNVRGNTTPVSSRYNTKTTDYLDETDVNGTGASQLFRDRQGRVSSQNNNANQGNNTNANQNSNNNNNDNMAQAQEQGDEQETY